jgi:hypothetical protein
MIRVLGVVTALIAGSVVCAEDPAIKALRNEVDTQVRAFDQEMSKAREASLKRFDAVIQKIQQNSRIPAATRASEMEELKRHRARFEKDGAWPDNTALINDAATYAARINKSYAPVARAFEKAIDACLKANDNEGVQSFTQAKAKVDERVRGDRFRAGSKWQGSRSGPKGSTLFTVHVKKVNDAVFEGEAHHNPGVAGHPIFEIKGEVNGNRIRCVTTRVIRGGAQALQFDGYILQDKILMGVGGVGGDGKAMQSNFVWLKCG